MLYMMRDLYPDEDSAIGLLNRDRIVEILRVLVYMIYGGAFPKALYRL